RYKWLVDVCDADGNPVGHPDYNPRTLFIPKSAWNKFTPFERQFWEIKCKFFDTVVFFKKGKFYELYENDADVGHRDFDLKMTDRVNMRMVGVPELSFNMWAGKFIAKGHKVAKVEQLETAIGKSLREKASKDGKAEKLIRRELTSVLTGGTLVDAGLLTNDMATYCLCIKEQVGPEVRAQPTIGIAFVDASCAEFNLCQFVDEPDRSRLETLLAQIQPKEVIYEKGHISKETMRVLKNTLHSTIWNGLVSGREFWDADTTTFEINGAGYFGDSRGEDVWPTALRDAKEKPLMLSATGGLIWYLRALRLDRELLSLKNFQYYDPVRRSTCLMIDGQTLKNLEIFENNFDGGDEGTLFRLLNKCVTPFGKRMFKRWVCHPLRCSKAINARLDAVDELNSDMSLQGSTQKAMTRLPDLERMVSRVHAGTCRLKDLFRLLDAFTALSKLAAELKETCENKSMPRIAALCARFPDLQEPLEHFSTAFDRTIAEREGSVIPFPGVEKDYDDIEERARDIQERFQSYLEEQRRELKSSKIIYRDIGKEVYQLEVPKNIKVPTNFMRLSQTKVVNRYWSPTLRSLVREFEETKEIRNYILWCGGMRVYAKFDEYYDLWVRAVYVFAELDCLLGLAVCATTIGEPCCRPEFVEEGPSLLELEELRHPCVIPGIAADFIPNDTMLGNDQARMILLTGPNMGGKSTLLRQTCIAIIMAQLGCYVPARRCRLTAVDRIFTRIGANDNIMAGQSTFMVELSETSKILHEATPRSLVILDELGRGTSTFDGYAIAYSVLHYLATYVGCLGLFSTHYGLLTEEMEADRNIRLMHMSCYVDEDRKEVTFLYKLTDGACPKSYGMHVANMAGVPTEIVLRAEEVAKEFEQQSRGHQLVMQHGKELTVADQGDFVYLQTLLGRCSLGDAPAATDRQEATSEVDAVRRIWRSWQARV
ncbi:muts domain V-domain-containing protein, partial [Thamnocephalis sphaerospora]